jgi:hypothetical protein
MNVYYIKLKNGEELLGIHDSPAEPDLESTDVFVQGAITFEADPSTGTAIAKYWIAYAEQKDVNISLNDTYFFGKATDKATQFYQSFLESINQESTDTDAYEGFNLDGMTDDDLEQIFDHGSKTRH